MQRSQYIRIDCDRRLLCGHMLVRKDDLQRVMDRLNKLGVRFKATITKPLVVDKQLHLSGHSLCISLKGDNKVKLYM